MKKTNVFLSVLLTVSLLAAAAVFGTASAEITDTASSEYIIPASESSPEIIIDLTGTEESPVELGNGAVPFLFNVVRENGQVSWFRVNTDEPYLGNALLAQNLIAGSYSDWGLYVESVLGIFLEYTDEHPVYWALYINDDYSMLGVDSVPVEADNVYSFRAEIYSNSAE